MRAKSSAMVLVKAPFSIMSPPLSTLPNTAAYPENSPVLSSALSSTNETDLYSLCGVSDFFSQPATPRRALAMRSTSFPQNYGQC